MGRKLRRLRVEGLKVSGLGKLTFKGFWGFWGFRFGRVLSGFGLRGSKFRDFGAEGLKVPASVRVVLKRLKI